MRVNKFSPPRRESMSIQGLVIAAVSICVFSAWDARAEDQPAATPTPDGPLVEKIVIKGNKKIETDAIRTKLVSKEGAPFNPTQVRQDLQELFNTGFFYDVQVDRSDAEP